MGNLQREEGKQVRADQAANESDHGWPLPWGHLPSSFSTPGIDQERQTSHPSPEHEGSWCPQETTLSRENTQKTEELTPVNQEGQGRVRR